MNLLKTRNRVSRINEGLFALTMFLFAFMLIGCLVLCVFMLIVQVFRPSGVHDDPLWVHIIVRILMFCSFVPLIVSIFLGAVYGMLNFILDKIIDRRVVNSRCVSCNYNLIGLDKYNCPECGCESC